MKKFKVELVDTPNYRDRVDAVTADSWYIDHPSGALVFLRSFNRFSAYGPRTWESVEETE